MAKVKILIKCDHFLSVKEGSIKHKIFLASNPLPIFCDHWFNMIPLGEKKNSLTYLQHVSYLAGKILAAKFQDISFLLIGVLNKNSLFHYSIEIFSLFQIKRKKTKHGSVSHQ